MSYVSVVEYVRAYGERETRLLTNSENTDPTASYDPAKVESALQTATDEVDGYVSRRYTTPLVTTPTIVASWVLALARLKLSEGTGRVSEAVKDAADRATRQMEQLAANKLNLPIAEGEAAPAAVGAGLAASSGDRAQPVFATDALRGFMDPFTGGDCAPRWTR